MVEMAYEQRELSSEEEAAAAGELRRGPWTVEEDLLLVNYIAAHGEGRWNALARCAGLKRTGKSCRLRWLNYLRPDLRRGNITTREQLLILELHERWGNRWSKIAQHLPGRTDNEIKNYWRTRVQKHARHLKCDVGSQQFKDLVRYLWMPRLVERVQSTTADDDGAVIFQTTPLPMPASACWAVDDVVSLSTGAADVELSCTTAVSSSSSVSADGGMQLVSPPAPLAAAAESAPGCNDGSYYSNNNTTVARVDTACQPPQTHGGLIMPQHQQPEGQFGGETCWSSESLPGGGLAGLYADIALPDLEIGGGETMWGACADDDLWYQQMLGLRKQHPSPPLALTGLEKEDGLEEELRRGLLLGIFG